jgi:hypothetical protein
MIARVRFDCQPVNFNRSDDIEASFFQALRQPSAASEQINSGLLPVQRIHPTLVRLAHLVGLFLDGDFKTKLLQNSIGILRSDLDGRDARQRSD